MNQINEQETAPLLNNHQRSPTLKKFLLFTVVVLIGTIAFIAYARTPTANQPLPETGEHLSSNHC